MSEVIDDYVMDSISILEEYIQNYQDKEFIFCNAILANAKLLQAERSRTVNKIYELKDEYSKITKHHKIQPEKLLETEILDALAEFICSPDQIDKHQLLQMENELIKMTNFADDKEQAYKINYVGFNIFSSIKALK